jgi:uncharacterized protein with HEPN domain
MKDDRVYFAQMLELAARVRAKTQKITKDEFLADDNLSLAVTHLLQTIGEAARLVSDKGKARFSAIPWRSVTGMRHRIVHDYLNIDVNVVWETAVRDIPDLVAALEEAQRTLDADQPS